MQNFRREQWAQDLLRDRARTRTLLFSGFGSEEPQIRHTVLTLIEEFANGYRKRKPDETMDLPNAPFIQVYDAYLSFYQLQILVGFLDAHSEPVHLGSSPEARIAPVFRNVFAGKPDRPLKAGAFFQKLFILVFCTLVQRAAQADGEFAFWLRNHTKEFRLWLDDFEWSSIKVLSSNRNKIWRHLIPLFWSAKSGAPFPLPFWRLLFTMLNPGEPIPEMDFYFPLRNNPVLILMTLVLLGRLRPPKRFAVPFELTVTPTDGTEFKVQLIAESAVQSLYTCSMDRPESRLRRLIAIPSRQAQTVDGRWPQILTASGGRLPVLIVGQWVAVAAGDLVEAAVRPDKLADTLRDCFATARPATAARLTRLYGMVSAS